MKAKLRCTYKLRGARCTKPAGHLRANPPIPHVVSGSEVKPRKREEPVVLTKEDWLRIAALIGLFDKSPGAMDRLHKIGLTGELAYQRGTKPARKREGRKR